MNLPVVQRAGDAPAVHDALRQWAALVWTLVTQRKHLVVQRAEHSNIALGGAHDTGTLAGDVFKRADFNPVVHRKYTIVIKRFVSARGTRAGQRPWHVRSMGRSARSAARKENAQQLSDGLRYLPLLAVSRN